jgi:hypothetical protein
MMLRGSNETSQYNEFMTNLARCPYTMGKTSMALVERRKVWRISIDTNLISAFSLLLAR